MKQPNTIASDETRPAYEPPAILWEEQLEVRHTLGASCAQHPTQNQECDLFPGA